MAPQSPQINYLLKTPSPKKLLRPTKACSNIRLLLDENKGTFFCIFNFEVLEQTSEDEEKVEETVTVFEDELPEQSLKIKKKKANESTQRKKPKSPQGNFVKANLKRKRYVSKSRSNLNAKKFKRFKRK